MLYYDGPDIYISICNIGLYHLVKYNYDIYSVNQQKMCKIDNFYAIQVDISNKYFT